MKKKKSILVIEDDPQLMSNLIQAFERQGYYAWGCPWVERAHTIFTTVRPDFVFLDLDFGDSRRMELIEKCKMYSPKTQIIVESASADGDLRDRAMTHGADLFLVKPFSLQPLFELLEHPLIPQYSV